MRPLVACSALGLLLSLIGCGNTKNNADAWTDEPIRELRPFRDVEVLGQGSNIKNDRPMSAWLGVRHDLTLANGQRTERCSCIAAEVGGAADPRFEWQGDVPTLGDDTLVIAIASQGVACPGGAADDRRRASISGVDRESDDVVVEIEEVGEGRPLATGAIIPKPGPKGAIYLRARNRKIVYARATSLNGRCKVQ